MTTPAWRIVGKHGFPEAKAEAPNIPAEERDSVSSGGGLGANDGREVDDA